MSLNVKYLFWWIPIFLVIGCSAVSCDFGVFVRGGELKSFYSAIFPRTKGLLLVWALAGSFPSMCRPLSPRFTLWRCLAHAHSWNGGGNAWRLLAGLRQAAAVCTLLGPQGQCLALALFCFSKTSTLAEES